MISDTAGLSLDQAPPISIPASFFAIVPLAFIAMGSFLLWHGGRLFDTHWAPQTIAATHIGTLGLLGSAMLGALYQMTPVLAGSAIPCIRLAHAVHLFWVLGCGALVFSLSTLSKLPAEAAFFLLIAAATLFAFPTGWALARAPARNASAIGMSLAVAAFALVTLLGLRMAFAYWTGRFPADRVSWIFAHAILALVVWVGGLLVSVSWQVVPMFYLTGDFPSWARRLLLLSLLVTMLGVPASLMASSTKWIALSALPAGLGVFALHPALTWKMIRNRRRARADISLSFWRVGLLISASILPLSAWAWLTSSSRAILLVGWLVIWGWAGLIVHGMLTRILPFLVWFHRFAPDAGIKPIPSMRSILPETPTRIGFRLHMASVVAGVLTIMAPYDAIAWIAGTVLIATGITIAVWIFAVLRRLAD